VNWRRGEAVDRYPEFQHVQQFFAQTFDTFCDFLFTQDIGAVRPDQCEMTYVDHIEPNELWERHGELEKVLTVWKPLAGENSLPEPESANVSARFVIPGAADKPLGRLYIAVQPGFRRSDGKPILVINSVARGEPSTQDREGVLAFFGAAHVWIRRGFLGFTSPEMQKAWERQDG
jgi:hypothetical protein